VTADSLFACAELTKRKRLYLKLVKEKLRGEQAAAPILELMEHISQEKGKQ